MVRKASDIFLEVPFEKLKNTKAWKITSEFVRKKSRGTCYTCGKIYPIERLHCGHFREKRGGSGTYFDLRNLRAQCYSCNSERGGMKDEYARKLVNEYGSNILNEIAFLASQSKRWTKFELDEIADERKKMLEELEIELRKEEL